MRRTQIQAEDLAPFKFYWTPFTLGLFTVPGLQPRGASGGLQHPAAAHCPALSSAPRGARVCRRKGLETGHEPFPHPGVGPSLSPQSWPKSHQCSHPTNPRHWEEHSQSLVSYVANMCPLASRPAARLRGPSVEATPGPRAAPFLSSRCSWASSPSLESDSSMSLRMSFSIWEIERRYKAGVGLGRVSWTAHGSPPLPGPTWPFFVKLWIIRRMRQDQNTCSSCNITRSKLKK